MAAISQTTLSIAFSWMKMLEFRLNFHWSLFLRAQLTIFHHWFRYWLGAVQATSHYLNQWWLVYWRIYASLGLNELINNDIIIMSNDVVTSFWHNNDINITSCVHRKRFLDNCTTVLQTMGLSPDTQNCWLCMRPECRERFPRHRLQRKPPVSDPGMHHVTCRDACQDPALTSGDRENVPSIPGLNAQPAILRIW